MRTEEERLEAQQHLHRMTRAELEYARQQQPPRQEPAPSAGPRDFADQYRTPRAAKRTMTYEQYRETMDELGDDRDAKRKLMEDERTGKIKLTPR